MSAGGCTAVGRAKVLAHRAVGRCPIVSGDLRIFPKFKEPGMKKSLLTIAVLLVGAMWAPAQAQTAAAPAPQKKEIKDPAEYNAYVNAIQTTDPNAKAASLEAFLQQYPNSVMKSDALH